MKRMLSATTALALCFAASIAVAQTSGSTTSRPAGTGSSNPPTTDTTSGGARSTPSGANSAGSATPTPGSTSSAATSGQAAGGGASAALTEPETTFIKKAAASDMTEIETSKVALTKATNADLKKFAQQMIDDHTKLSTSMKQIATAKNVQLPPRDPSIDAMVSKLNGLSGKKFDEEYVKGQVAGHRDASKLFHTEGAQVRDPQLKQAVASATPIIDQHLQHVEQLAASLGVEGKTSLKK
jgi:putative membrane protein